jgi:2-oxoglutarate/2-oxoacid ferredoxin oxidoreductase subunit beta
MHDGSTVRFRKIDEGHDPTNRDAAYALVRRIQAAGEVPTGLFYVGNDAPEMHELNRTVATPLVELPYERLCPGAAALEGLMEEYR